MDCCSVWLTTKGTTENKTSLQGVTALESVALSQRRWLLSDRRCLSVVRILLLYPFFGLFIWKPKRRCNIIQKQNITPNLTLIHNTFSAFNKFLGVKYAFITLQHIYLYILLMGYFIAVCVADTHRIKGEFTQNKKVCHYLPSSHSKSLCCYF